MATRAERKAKQRALFAQMEADKQRKIQERAEYERKHPVLSGAVKIVEYVEPTFHYTKNPAA